ncbi:MAG TPA: FAD-binding oxidoreductase [Solirubrobacterales bacterium]
MSSERRLKYLASRRPERSLWLQEALEGETDAPRLEGDERADVCIVGGGYTGLYTALRIKELEPSVDVTIVEADICGGGPSGRNGGFMESWWIKFAALEAICGTEEALRLARHSAETVDLIIDLCAKHGIDAHIRRKGWVLGASNPTQVGSWRSTVAALEAHGVHEFEELDRARAQEITGSERYLSGLFEPQVTTLHPGHLARGLRRVALEQGVRILEHSPVMSLQRNTRPRVRTAHGSVEAERLVLAIGPWLVQVAELRNSFAVIATDMVATERIPDRLHEIGIDTGIGISDARMLLNYYRSTLDGRLAWGKGGGSLAFAGRIGDRLHGPSHRPQEVAPNLRWFYPQLADVRITHSWTGPVDRSVAGLPFFTHLPDSPAILYGGGYSGNGVVPTFFGGRVLASLALERDDEYSGCGLVRDPIGKFPPEPVRWIGGLAVRGAVERKERFEDRGRRPDLPTRVLAGFAPPGPAEARAGG